LRLRVNDDFELDFVSHLPARGSASQGLRILSESWAPERDRLDLDVAGLPGNTYELTLSNASQVISVDGAQLNKKLNKKSNKQLNKKNPRAAGLLVRFPAATTAARQIADAYTQRRIVLQFVPKRQAAAPRQN